MSKIFSALAQGRNADEIDGMFDRDVQRGNNAREKGQVSEKNVETALLQLGEVTAVRVSKAHGRSDRKGVDINVFLKGRDVVFQHVRVQVKSSEGGIDRFKRFIMEKHRLKDLNELGDFLIQQRLVILNGRQPREQIQTSFRSQLQALCKK